MKRIFLLSVLGIEGLNAVIGGLILIVSPEGRLMNMPATVMHGTFSDFSFPGIILFSMGIISILAVVAIVMRSSIDWIITYTVLVGFVIWFTVQIIILKGVNFLHLVFGLPILISYWAAYPLVPSERKYLKSIDLGRR